MSVRVIVTGGAGFLGTLLVRRLLAGPVAAGGAGPALVGELVVADLAAPPADVTADPPGPRAGRRPGRGHRRGRGRGRDLPPGRGGERRGRGRLRPGPAGEPGRDALGARARPAAGGAAGAGLLQLGR